MPLHPFMSEMLAKAKAANRPAFSDGTPADTRALIAATRAAMGSGPDMARVEDITIPVQSGAIAARLYVPEVPIVGLMVYLHGGGWMAGALDDFDTLARELAMASHCAVLLPDYRLAPEYPFPTPLDDALTATRWANVHARDVLGADLPLVLAGDSAGGNLAAVCALVLRGEITVRLQILVYPVVDCDFDRRSYLEHATGMPLTRKDMIWFFDNYLLNGGQREDALVSPYRTSDLKGAPPALIFAAEYDVLRDEAMAYAARLAEAGVEVNATCRPGMTHGFLRMHNLLEPARQAVHEAARMARAACTQELTD